MIYSLNEARNAEEYRAEKAAREKAEQGKKDKQFSDRYYGKNKSDFVRKIRPNGDKEDVYPTYKVGDRNRIVGLVSDRGIYYGAGFKDMDRRFDASRVADRNAKSSKKRNEFSDAVNRNMRRHPERWDRDKPVKPKSESTIFDNIEII